MSIEVHECAHQGWQWWYTVVDDNEEDRYNRAEINQQLLANLLELT